MEARTRELLKRLSEKGLLRESYVEVFEKTAKTPFDVLFSNVVDPEGFAETVSEITGVPFERDPKPVPSLSKGILFGEDEWTIEEMFREKRLPIKGGEGVLFPTGREGERVISYTAFKSLISFYARISPVIIEEEYVAKAKDRDLTLLLLVQAVALGASDIHVDVLGNTQGAVFLRIDGDLTPFCSLGGRARDVVASFMTLSGRDSSGAVYEPFSLSISGEEILQKDYVVKAPEEVRERLPLLKGVDFRIEVTPTASSLSCVVRVLDRTKTFWKLSALGLRSKVVTAIERLLPRRGIFVVTGETGSGKTTTCYAALLRLDAVRKKIVTIEDPVELKNPFWRQLQRREQGEYRLSFRNMMASVLRQDPDVILVGEVRDSETAMLLFQAANTGHSVISTLHTNSVYDTITRLADLLRGVASEDEIRLRLSSLLKAVLSQRLLKRVCPYCREKEGIPYEVFEALSPEARDELKRKKLTHHMVGKGCQMCGGTGYRGRVLVSEFLIIDREVARAILEMKMTRHDFAKFIKEQGFSTMIEDAVQKVAEGETNFYQIMERL